MRIHNKKMARALVHASAALVIAASLSACGFQLRGSNGSYSLPFHSLYLSFSDNSALGVALKRNLRATDGVVIVDKATDADAQFIVLTEARNKSILSLNALGRVREYLLSYTLSFTVRDAKGNVLLAPTEVTLHRNMSFDETQVLAKQSEEALLYNDMQSDIVQQILRRMAAIKPPAP
jgi:LPS-assembly lipoprotein